VEEKDVLKKIGDAGAVALAEALKGNKTLKDLHLDSNRIGDKGAAALAAALAANDTLQFLNIEHNGLSKGAVEQLRKAAKESKSLQIFVADQSLYIAPPPTHEPEDEEDIPPPPPPLPEDSPDGTPSYTTTDDFLTGPTSPGRRESFLVDGVQVDFSLKDNPLAGAGRDDEKGAKRTYRKYVSTD